MIRVKRKRDQAPPEFLGDNGSVLKKARLPGKIFQLLPKNRLQQQQQHQPAPESLQKSRIEVELRGTVQNGLDVFEARIRKATSIIYGRKTESVNLSTMMDRYLQFHTDASALRMTEEEGEEIAEEEGFVYDTYQVASEEFAVSHEQQTLENVCRIQRVVVWEGDGEAPLVYDEQLSDEESEDSNAEDHWAHDYPDEDYYYYNDSSSINGDDDENDSISSGADVYNDFNQYEEDNEEKFDDYESDD